MIKQSKKRAGERFSLTQEEEYYLLYGRKYPFLVENLLKSRLDSVHDGCGCGGKDKSPGGQQTGQMVRTSAMGRAISLDPKTGQGYLVLNRAGNPKVDRWLVTVSAAVMRKGRLVEQRQVESIELANGLNWWRVPRKYLSAEGVYIINVQGMSSSNALVVEEGPLLVSSPLNPGVTLETGGTPWILGCKWVCNGAGWVAGRGYAWEIQEMLNPTGVNEAYYEVSTAYASFDEESQLAVPFYSYFMLEAYNALSAAGLLPSVMDGVNVTHIFESTPQNQVQDDDGVGLIGPVVGVAKGLGPWADRILITDYLQGNTSINLGCNPSSVFQRNWAIGRINSYADFSIGTDSQGIVQEMPPLACVPSKAGTSISGGTSCGANQVMANHLNNSGGPITTWQQLLDLINGCIGQGSGWQAHMWKNKDRFEFFSISDTGNDGRPPVVFGDSVVLSDNEARSSVRNRELTLTPGLYTFGFTGGGFYVPVIIEINREVQIR